MEAVLSDFVETLAYAKERFQTMKVTADKCRKRLTSEALNAVLQTALAVGP